MLNFQLHSKYKYLKYCKPKFPFHIDLSCFHRVSEKFPPVKDSLKSISDNKLSLSYQLLLDNGIITSQHSGLFTLLPLGLRAVEKLIKLLDSQMKKVNGQKLSLPSLTRASLWEKTGRLETCGVEVMRLNDRHHHQYILSPTHEEPITNLVSIAQLSHSHLPLRLYQISTKFRDEARLKHGLLRGREFLMKDLYTFDETLKDAECTYEEILKIYLETFNILTVPIKEVEAAVGVIGGIKSHEFHVPNAVGEDSLMFCKACDYTVNCELDTALSTSKCPHCSQNMIPLKGIEVGHAFLLGTKYSSPLSANYRDANQKGQALQMGCFGIGVTRLLSAGIEALSSPNQLIWPTTLAPFKVCLIPPKKGSKEACSSHWCDHLEHIISQISGYEDEVIVDDRTNLTIGKRLNQAKGFGYPITIVVGKSSLGNVPLFELFISKTNEKLELTQSDIIEYLRQVESGIKKIVK